MSKIFDCSRPECSGELDANDFIFPPVSGCTISHISLVCSVCRLIHGTDGLPKVFKADHMAFLRPEVALQQRVASADIEQRPMESRHREHGWG